MQPPQPTATNRHEPQSLVDEDLRWNLLDLAKNRNEWWVPGKVVELRMGRSFFDGPDTLHRTWRFDRETVFERIRVLNATPNLALVEPALRDIVAACPELEGIQAARVWAGWIDLTPDVVPVIDNLAALPGLTVATELSGHGFGIGPAIGELAAQLASGATPLVDASPFRLARFQ